MSSNEVIYQGTDFPEGEISKSPCLSGEGYSLVPSSDDIYDIATDIGHDFEKLVQIYGYDAFATLLPKVVQALEGLENSMKKSESSNAKLNEMRQTVVALEKERVQRNNERLKFENDVDEMETLWKNERAELVSAIRRLTEENTTLRAEAQRRRSSVSTDSNSSQQPSAPAARAESPSSDEVILRLQHQIDRLTEDVNDKSADVENLQKQLNRLSSTHSSLLETQKQTTKEVEQLLEEKAELENQFTTSEKRIAELTHRVKILHRKERDQLEMEIIQRSNVLKEPGTPYQDDWSMKPTKVDSVSVHPLERHYSLEEASTGTPLPDLNISETEERLVYGPINREPDDKMEPGSRPEAGRSIRDFFQRMFSRL